MELYASGGFYISVAFCTPCFHYNTYCTTQSSRKQVQFNIDSSTITRRSPLEVVASLSDFICNRASVAPAGFVLAQRHLMANTPLCKPVAQNIMSSASEFVREMIFLPQTQRTEMRNNTAILCQSFPLFQLWRITIQFKPFNKIYVETCSSNSCCSVHGFFSRRFCFYIRAIFKTHIYSTSKHKQQKFNTNMP